MSKATLRRRYGRAHAPKAEARRQGEIAGSQHADGWISRNHPNLDELESAYVTGAEGIRDVGVREGRDKFGWHGKREEKSAQAFADGYVEAWKLELRREMGRLR